MGALVQYFDTAGDGQVDTVQFLLHFSKINRIEREKIHLGRIEADKNVLRKQQEEEEARYHSSKFLVYYITLNVNTV